MFKKKKKLFDLKRTAHPAEQSLPARHDRHYHPPRRMFSWRGGIQRRAARKQSLAVICLIAFLTLGAWGAVSAASEPAQTSGWGVFSSIAELFGLTESEKETVDQAVPPNGSMQLSKEYIYAGSRMLAIEDYGVGGSNPTPTPNPSRTNFALATNGAVISASSEISGFPAQAAINGDRKGLNWGSGGGWNDNTANTYPDAVQVNFSGTKAIDEINIFTLQDNYQSPVDPIENMTFSVWGTTDFEVQYWNGSNWLTAPNGAISGNNKVWRKIIFSAIETNSIRLIVNNALQSHARITEIEAFGVTTNNTVSPPPSLPPASTPTPTPTLTPTPTPTPAPAVPSIASVAPNADPTCLDITLNGVSGADSYNVKVLSTGYTINVTGLSFPWCGLAPATYYEYQAQAVNQYGTSGWSGIVGGTTANPPPTPESYSVSAVWHGSFLMVNWSASPERPANTDTIIVFPTNNPGWTVISYSVSGGSGEQSAFYNQLDPGNYTIKYLKDGTTEVASDNFNVD